MADGGKRDKQIMIAGYPKHVGLYPGPDAIEAFADRLAPYKPRQRVGFQVALDKADPQRPDPQHGPVPTVSAEVEAQR